MYEYLEIKYTNGNTPRAPLYWQLRWDKVEQPAVVQEFILH